MVTQVPPLTAPTSKIAPPQSPIIHFQLCSSTRISVYRYALTVFGQGQWSNCCNDIAFAKKKRGGGRRTVLERKRKWGERERWAAATHREPLRTHSMSGLALSRRHQGHCNEINRGGEGGGEHGRGGQGNRGPGDRLVMLKSEGSDTCEFSHIDQITWHTNVNNIQNVTLSYLWAFNIL